MKKKMMIGIVILITVIILCICLKFISFGTKKTVMGASLISLEVPKLSSVKSECCLYSATFKSISSVSVLEEELENIISKYYKITCDNNTYYYNMTDDITITEYGVDSGFIFNTFYINYSKGNYCNN